MKKKIFTVVKVLIFLGIGFLFIWFFVKDLTTEQWQKIFNAFSSANYWWIVLSLFIALMSHVVRTLRWQMLLEPVAGKTSFVNTFLSLMIGYFANLALPRLGEVSRCGILAKYEKVAFQKSFGTVVTERALDLLSFILLFVINFFLQYHLISDYVSNRFLGPLSEKFSFIGKGYLMYAGIAFLIIVVLFFVVFHKKLKKYKFYQKIIHVVKGFWDGLKSLTKIKQPLLFIFYTLALWGLYFFMTWVCFFSLGETSDAGAAACMSVLMMGTIGIIIVQGGIGIYPVLVAETLVLYGIPSITGFALGWLIWATQESAIILSGIISLILLPVLNHNKNGNSGSIKKENLL